MAKRGKGLAYNAINDGRAVKIASWSKEKDSAGPRQGPTWGEFLTGFFVEQKGGKLYLVKYGSLDTPYEMRKLHPNNSKRSAGSKGTFITEDEAREWVKENDLDKGTLEDLENFLTAHELIQDLKT